MPRRRLLEGQSSTRIVYIGIDGKSWTARFPTVDEDRPGWCLACGAASRPAGGRVVLHGHGLRPRDQWSPPAAAGPPEVTEVVGRRYACQARGAVMLVVPRGVLRRRPSLPRHSRRPGYLPDRGDEPTGVRVSITVSLSVTELISRAAGHVGASEPLFIIGATLAHIGRLQRWFRAEHASTPEEARAIRTALERTRLPPQHQTRMGPRGR